MGNVRGVAPTLEEENKRQGLGRLRTHITYAYALFHKGKWFVSEKTFEGATKHYAVWSPATQGVWGDYTKLKPHDQESWAWKLLCLETSLTPVKRDSDNQLSDDNWDEIRSYIPAALPHILVEQYLQNTYLKPTEVNQIERDAMKLWGSKGIKKGSGDFHPLLEKTQNALVLWEKFGTRVWENWDDLTTYEVHGIFHCLNCYVKVMELGDRERDLRNQARRESGGQRFMGSAH